MQTNQCHPDTMKNNQPRAHNRLVVILLVSIIMLLLCVLGGVLLVGAQLYIKSNSPEALDMEIMAHDMKTFMPQIQNFVPQVTSAMENVKSGDLNITSLMQEMKDFNALVDLGRDMKAAMPQIKAFIPQLTAALNETGKSGITDLMHQMKAMGALADKLANPLSMLLDGVFEANTDVSRWRAVGLKVANIFQKMARVDYSVSQPNMTWDATQDCEGQMHSDFKGQDAAIYQTADETKCLNFNLNAVGTKGHGTCKWNHGKCEEADHNQEAYRWIRNVESADADIISKDASDGLRARFSHIQKFTSDFGGNPSQVPKLKSETMIDIPMSLSVFMDSMMNPSMMSNVVDATTFLEKQVKISSMICDPNAGKETQLSCKWLDEGFVPAVDSGFKIGLTIVRTIFKNLHTVWSE